jgi:hypothetical protein
LERLEFVPMASAAATAAAPPPPLAAPAPSAGVGTAVPAGLRLPKELRHKGKAAQEATASVAAKREALKAALDQVDRLCLLAARAEECAVWVGPGCRRVVVVLPHAHVTPDQAISCLRFRHDMRGKEKGVTISVVQLPCCGFVFHDTCLGARPDSEKLDGRVCTGARTVRVWRDVAPRFNFQASEAGRGAATAAKFR